MRVFAKQLQLGNQFSTQSHYLLPFRELVKARLEMDHRICGADLNHRPIWQVEMSSFVFQLVFAQVPRCFRQVTCPYPKAGFWYYLHKQGVHSSSQHNTLFGRLKRLEARSAPLTTHRLDLNMGRPYIAYQCYCAMILIWQKPLTTLPS